MHAKQGAARYGAMRSHGQVADASPTRLVQIMFEHILSHFATAQGCMDRIRIKSTLNDVTVKLEAMRKAILLVGQLNETLDMERGGGIAQNLRALYEYILVRLAVANAANDSAIMVEVSSLVRDIKAGWDGIVTDVR